MSKEYDDLLSAQERLFAAETDDDYHDPAAICRAEEAVRDAELKWREACPGEAMLDDAVSLRRQAEGCRRKASDAAGWSADMYTVAAAGLDGRAAALERGAKEWRMEEGR